MPQLVWTADAEGRVTYFNKQRSAYRRRERSNALEWQAVVHPDDLERTRSSWRDAVATGKPYECEHRVQRADGSFRWQLSRARCVNAGGTNRWYGTATDIHDLRLREEQVKLLLREVNHRSKNLLTVVLAIARQTSREGTASAFVPTFTERIQALAACQDLLVNASWQGVDLGDLVRIQLAHFGDLLGKRIRTDGPQISISPPAAQAIGMAVHELGTNAMKYGALSNACGEVCITWNLVSSPEGKRFRMSWIETGGPPVPPPERRGFGLVVLERMTPASLSGRAELTYAPEGLRWNIDAPSQYVVDLR